MRIAIWNTAWLGDAVLTLPLIQTIKNNFPQANIDYFVRKGLKELFRCHPAIKNVYEVDKKNMGPLRSIKFAKALAPNQYSIWISAHQSLRSSMVSHFAHAPIRISYDSGPVSRWVYTHTVDRAFYNFEEIERLLKLAVPLGLEINFDDREANWPEIALCPSPRAKADQIWQAIDSSRPVIGIHPGSVWPTKRWPAEYFSELAKLALEHGVQVVLFSGPDELKQAELIRRENENTPGFIDLAGKLPLPELAACIAKLDCYVTNDSGPMHLAWVQRVPTTAIFGPTTRELGFFPRGKNSSAIELNLRCRPCGLHGHKQCPQKHHACMRDISPQTVWLDVAAKIGLSTEQNSC